jgi:DNA-binding NarL/FixJ family response regulator
MPIRILIADDNSQVRAAMRDVLGTAGEWEIIEAENGDQAVAKAREFRPQLVVLDLVMPRKDGLVASREIAQFLPGTPILMHTLYSSPEVQIAAAQTGVRKVVPKSESIALIAAVQEALHQDAPANPGAAPSITPAEQEEARRRTEDRIRELCVQIIAGSNSNDETLKGLLSELRIALHQHLEQFRSRILEFPSVTERRIRNGLPLSSEPIPFPNSAETPAAPIAPPPAVAKAAEETQRVIPKKKAPNRI